MNAFSHNPGNELTYAPVPSPTFPAARAQLEARPFRSQIVIAVLLCAVPVCGLLMAGKATMAGLVFWTLCGTALLRLLLLRRHEEFLSLLIGLIPLIALLRQYAFYNVIVVLFATGLLFYHLRSPGTVRYVLRACRPVVFLLVFVSLLWLIAFLLTGDYAVNLRFLDFGFAVLAVLLVGRRSVPLGAALTGMILSAWAVGIGMIPHIKTVGDERLGIMIAEGHRLGNPVSLGLPLAFGLLAMVVDRGRWLNLQDKPLHRFLMLLPTAALLALTGSRNAWLVATGSLTLVLLFGGRQRIPVLALMGLAAVVVQALLLSPYGEGLQRALDRTFGEDRTLRSRTSGRTDMWLIAGHVLTESVNNLVHGYGPGSQKEVYREYSVEVEDVEFMVGKGMQFHSIYLQLVVETGLLGLVPFTLWLLAVLLRVAQWTMRNRRLLPLVGICGYIYIGLAINGSDPVSGVFLGMGMLAAFRAEPHERGL